MGPPSQSFAAEAHLLLHGPDPRGSNRIQGCGASFRVQLATSPRFDPVSILAAPICLQLDRRKPIQALTQIRRPELMPQQSYKLIASEVGLAEAPQRHRPPEHVWQ